VPTRLAGIDGNNTADPDGGDTWTDRPYCAGDFVANNHRLLQSNGPEAAVQVVVKIRTANAASADRDFDLTIPEHLFVAFLDPQVTGCVNGDDLHIAFLD
jgi:hypothetical protein